MKNLFNYFGIFAILLTMSIFTSSCTDESSIIAEDEPIITDQTIFTDEEINEMINLEIQDFEASYIDDIDLINQGPNLTSTISKLNISADINITAEPLINLKGQTVGTKLRARGTGIDQSGNRVNVWVFLALNMRTEYRWGAMAFALPGEYYTRLQQIKTNNFGGIEAGHLITGDFYSTTTTGTMAGHDITGNRIGEFHQITKNIKEIFNSKPKEWTTIFNGQSASISFEGIVQ